MNIKTKVLVCDENTNEGIKLANTLRAYGFYTYTRRKDGNVVFNSIISDKPDVVIMDSHMINMDALSLIKRLKKTEMKSPTFIVTSMFENPSMEKKLMENGVSYFLLKPFDCEGLCEIISDIIQDNESYGCERLESIVTEIIHKIGVPTKIKGFDYLRTAILASYENNMLLKNVTTRLYPGIAKKFNTTEIRVERDIRHAITSAWSKGNPQALNEIFGYTLQLGEKRPTNSEFISLITENLLIRYKYSGMTM